MTEEQYAEYFKAVIARMDRLTELMAKSVELATPKELTVEQKSIIQQRGMPSHVRMLMASSPPITNADALSGQRKLDT